MNTVSVPPLLGGPADHDFTGSLGNLTKPSVMRGSALWKSGLGPPLWAIKVGRGPPPGAGALVGFGGGGGGAQPSISSDSPTPPANAPPAVRRRKERRLTCGLGTPGERIFELAFVGVPQLVE